MHDYRHNVTKFRFTQQYKYNVGIKFLELYQIFGINITRHFLMSMRYLIVLQSDETGSFEILCFKKIFKI
jgi:hypothetical protein